MEKQNLKLMQNSFLKTMRIIFFALLAGQIIFMAVAFFTVNNNPPQSQSDDLFNIIVPVAIGLGLFMSSLLFKQMLAKIKKDDSFEQKLEAYRSALIIRYALLEVPSIFSTVVYLFSGNIIFLAFSGVMILAFLINMPSRDKATQDLNLSSIEADKL
jgi:anaerobic C4-dicarboxylate transporter